MPTPAPSAVAPQAAAAPMIVPAGPRSSTLLAFGTLVTGEAGSAFAMPAHALCIVTGVLAGEVEVEVDASDAPGDDRSDAAPQDAASRWRRLPAWSVQGPQTLARRWRAAPGTRAVSMLLRAHVVAERLGRPAASCRDRWIEPAALAGLLTAIDVDDDVQVSAGARRDDARRRRIAHALSRARSVPEAACGLGLSERSLQRLCDRDVGLPPVVLSRLLRMHRCTAIGLAGGRRGADAALAAGYADQAHMARDFRLLGGVRPRDLDAASGWTLRESAARVVPAWLGQLGLSDSSKTPDASPATMPR